MRKWRAGQIPRRGADSPEWVRVSADVSVAEVVVAALTACVLG